MAGYDTLRSLVNCEFGQSLEEGKDPVQVEALRTAFGNAGDDVPALHALFEELQSVPVRPDFPFQEPSDLEGIRAGRTVGPEILPMSHTEAFLTDRLYGAWLGRCAGCALGKPAEAFLWPHNGLSSKERVKQYLLGVSPEEYPIRAYLPANSPSETETGTMWGGASSREQIAFMESDDDIRYTVIGQLVLQGKGRDFTTLDVANSWIQHLPYGWVCTAETQAYRNLVERYSLHSNQLKDEDIDWAWISRRHNPYREWIGAQIRADSWGYAAPGNPELAAEFAWRDARLSHVKNGIYGAMFCAAMIAAAFVFDDPLKIVEAGLAQIPSTSRLFSEMRQVIEICRKYDDDAAQFEPVLEEISQLLGHYSPVHTNNNAGIVVAALLLGGQDFEKVITIAVMGGWDTDCNGATAGSICGAMLGSARLPAHWIDPLHDTLNSQIIGYHPISIRECAQRSLQIAQRVSGNI